MNSDFKDLLRLLHEEEVRYLIVRGYAVIHYSQPRYTKNIDIWLKPIAENAAKVMRVFARFWDSDVGTQSRRFCDRRNSAQSWGRTESD